jgi:dethiobiotin synthetase
MNNHHDSRAFLVTGTDTEIGKTNISCGLLRLAQNHGYRSCGLKPVSAGCENTPDGLRNEDAIALQAASSVRLGYDLVNPWAFEPPISPHIAAEQLGIKTLDLAPIAHSLKVARKEADWILVEGFGGWYAPLDQQRTFADLAQSLRLPVILVVGLRLGCLNHALLSARAIAQDGLELIGWVGNQIDANMSVMDANVERLVDTLQAPCLGVVEYGCTETDQVAKRLRLP